MISFLICGTPASGKSTLAGRISGRYGLPIVDIDDSLIRITGCNDWNTACKIAMEDCRDEVLEDFSKRIKFTKSAVVVGPFMTREERGVVFSCLAPYSSVIGVSIVPTLDRLPVLAVRDSLRKHPVGIDEIKKGIEFFVPLSYEEGFIRIIELKEEYHGG